MLRADDPGADHGREREAEQAPRASPVTAAGAKIPASQEDCGQKQHRRRDVCGNAPTSPLRDGRRRPRHDRLTRSGTAEGHRHAALSGRFDMQRCSVDARLRPFPGAPLGGVGARRQLRRHLVECVEVEAGGREERRPRRRARRRGLLLAARRHGFERQEPARVVQLQARHADACHRRVAPGWRPIRGQRSDGLRAGSIPELHDRRRAPVERVPAILGGIRARDVGDDVEVDRQSARRVDAVERIAERHHDVAGAILQGVERLLHRHASVEQLAIAGQGADDKGCENEADDSGPD